MKEHHKLAMEFITRKTNEIWNRTEYEIQLQQHSYQAGFLKCREMAYDVVNKAETSRRVPEMIDEIKTLGEKEV